VNSERRGRASRSRSSLPVRMPAAREKATSAEESSDDEMMGGPGLVARLRDLHLNPTNARWIGKSSGAKLVLSALALKNSMDGTSTSGAAAHTMLNTIDAARVRRPEFWKVYEVRHIFPDEIASRTYMVQWELAESPTPTCHLSSGPGSQVTAHLSGQTIDRGSRLKTTAHTSMDFEFPPQDLLPTLVEAYFNRVNIITPLLHRPTFDRALEESAHHSDTGFCMVLLLVCANGARFVNDERVLIEGSSTHSAGWQWFSQTHALRRSAVSLPCIHDLQICCVRLSFIGHAHSCISQTSSSQRCFFRAPQHFGSRAGTS
jgi:hypothetical protein